MAVKYQHAYAACRLGWKLNSRQIDLKYLLQFGAGSSPYWHGNIASFNLIHLEDDFVIILDEDDYILSVLQRTMTDLCIERETALQKAQNESLENSLILDGCNRSIHPALILAEEASKRMLADDRAYRRGHFSADERYPPKRR